MSAFQDDCLVKVWYNTNKWKSCIARLFTPPDASVSLQGELAFSFVYLAHPRSVTGFSWRKTSKYMPRYAYGHTIVSTATNKRLSSLVVLIEPMQLYNKKQ